MAGDKDDDKGGSAEPAGKTPDDSKVDHDPALKNETCFHFPDCIFMWGWIASLVIMFWIAMQYGVAELNAQYDEYQDQLKLAEAGESYLIDDAVSDAIVGCVHITKIFAICMAFAVVVSFIWTVVMIIFGEIIIHLLFFIAIGLFGTLGFVAMFVLDSQAAYYAGFGFFGLAALGFLYWCCIRNRIHFAATTLAIACKIVQHDFMLFIVAFLMLVLTGCYTLVFGLAQFGVYFKIQGDDDSTASQTNEVYAYFTLLLMFLWTVQVFGNILVVTVSGCAEEWWFAAEGAMPVVKAFCRAITYDLGAICFGSLLVAIIQTLYAILMYLAAKAKKQGNKLMECVLYCLACCVACLEKCVEYMNKYAYTYVGIYGYGFMTAGMKVMSLFVNEGLTIIQNDLIVEYLLLFGNAVVGALTAGLGIIVVQRSPAEWTEGLHPYAQLLVGIISFIIGFGIAMVMNGVIDAANKAVFILFLENPGRLAVTHPAEHDRLASAWKLIGHSERAEDVA